MSNDHPITAKLVIILKADDVVVEELESPDLRSYFLRLIIQRRVPETAENALKDTP